MTKPDVTISDDGIYFAKGSGDIWQITTADEYRFSDIQPNDRVLDIGANVGAFCIRAARLSRHVAAVEPVTCGILRENLRRNNAEVTVICGGLGNGEPCRICWDGVTIHSPTFSLKTLIHMTGGCDFLKCDCEGAEWQIRPEYLDGIRRIEMELHMPPICGAVNPALLDYIGRHYDFEIERKPCHDVMGVMGILHAVRL